jgi:hypothetical protein
MISKDLLKEMVGVSKIEEAIDLLIEKTKGVGNKYHNNLITLRSSLTDIEDKNNIGTLQGSEYLQEKSKITDSFLKILDKVSVNISNNNPEKNENHVRKKNIYEPVQMKSDFSGNDSISAINSDTNEQLTLLRKKYSEKYPVGEDFDAKVELNKVESEIRSLENSSEKKHILFFNSSSNSLSDTNVSIQKKAITDEIKDSNIKLIDFPLIEPEKIVNELLKYNSVEFVHFMMHGKDDCVVFKDNIKGKDDEIEHISISNRFASMQNDIRINYVFFIVCNSNKLAREVSKYVNYTIGMNGTILNDENVNAATVFATSLYRILKVKDNIELSFKQAILDLYDTKYRDRNNKYQYEIPELFKNGELLMNYKSILNK